MNTTLHPRYIKAIQRSDLSEHLVHLIRPASTWPSGYPKDATATLHSIFNGHWIIPTIDEHVTRYCPEGVACFHDAPPTIWPEIVATNPNDRLPLGLIVCKRTMWKLGGRPAIYSDNSSPDIWPEPERFRVIHTDLNRNGHPIDWMHEREWRIRGGLFLNQLTTQWWWPLVPNEQWKDYLFDNFANLHNIYVMDRGQTVARNA